MSRNITLAAGSQAQNFQLSQEASRIDDVNVTGLAEATVDFSMPATPR